YEEHISQKMQIVHGDENEEEEDLFEAKLISPGRLAGDVEKLQHAKIYTCNGLLMRNKKSLTGIKGLSPDAKAYQMCAAADTMVNFGYITCGDSLLKITVGCLALDELSGGGIVTSAITETFGKSSYEKAMLADTFCVLTQLPTSVKGGIGKAAFDTEGILQPVHIVPIAENFGVDAAAVLDNCTSGFKALNELLGGEIVTFAITETFRKLSSGKIKLAHTLCVFTQLPTSMKGGIGKVGYIDTEGIFRPALIVPIAEKFGVDVVAVLDNEEDFIIIRSTSILKVNSDGTNAENVNNLQYAGIYTYNGLMIHTMKNTTGSPSRTTYNPIPINRVDNLRLGRNLAVYKEEFVDLMGLNPTLFLEDDDDYVNRVGNVVPILEFQNSDWENTFDVENNMGDRQGEVDLDTCLNWGDLTLRVHDVYVQQTGNQPIDGVNSANCWPGQLVQFCFASGYPGLNQWDDAFIEVKVLLDIIKIRPAAN
ncbi:hypothetical protein KSS87_007479, partial [Heliosperma pusillum]